MKNVHSNNSRYRFVAALGLAMGLGLTGPAFAATITVNSNGDTGDVAPGDGVCGTPGVPNTCTLRAAISVANEDTAADYIDLDTIANAGTASGRTISIATQDLPAITAPVSIGPHAGSPRVIIDGNDLRQLFQFTGGNAGTYELKQLVIQNGKSASSGGGVNFAVNAGGAVFNVTDVDVTSSAAATNGQGIAVNMGASGGVATLTRVNLSTNGSSSTPVGDGGGLWVRLLGTSTLTLQDSTVSSNNAVNGGGLAVKRGTVKVYESTIDTNAATTLGGGIYLATETSNVVGGSVWLENVTLSTNDAATGAALAAASDNPSASSMIYTTVTLNTSAASGGGAIATNGTNTFPGNSALLPFTSNIIGGNTEAGSTKNCKTAFAASHAGANSGYNLTDDSSCGFGAANQHDQVVTDNVTPTNLSDIGVGSLATNGAGTPKTHAVLAGSPAIDAGNPGWNDAIDERHADLQDGGADGTPGDSAPTRDIGAYEYGGFGLIDFTIASASVNIDEDNGPLVLGIKRYGTLGTSAASSTPTVTFLATDGSATSGTCDVTVGTTDYDTGLASNTTDLAFTNTGVNQFDQSLSIGICDDRITEVNENFSISLSKPSGGDSVGYDLGPKASGTVTIKDVENGLFQFAATTSAAAEGDATGGSVTLTINRTGGSSGPVDVTYSTRDTGCSGTCTATSGTDYTGVANGVVHFADGQLSNTLTINFIGDTAFEANETFEVKLNAASCTTAGRSCDARLGSAASQVNTVTITNDDAANPGAFQFSAASYTALESTGSLVVTVQRVNGSDGAVTVDCGGQDGTGAAAATSPGDYAVQPTSPPVPLHPCQLSWGDGVSTDKTFTVSIPNDAQPESNKTFTLTLTNPAGGAGGQTPTVMTASAPVTIVSADQPQFQFNSTPYSFSESGGNATIKVSWATFTGGDVTIPYWTIDGTATSPADYSGIPQASPSTLTIKASDTSPKQFTIPIVNDGNVEGNEDFQVQLGTPTGGGQVTGTNPATVTIVDPASVKFAATSFTSANELGNSTITVTVTRQGNTANALSVDYTISQNCPNPPTAGCAEEAVDYTAGSFSGTLSWVGTGANSSELPTKTFTITIIGDTLIEGDESIALALSNPTGGALGSPSTATAVIKDDDYKFVVANMAVNESAGNATLNVQRVGSTVGAASVHFATADGSATAGSDYAASAAGTSGNLNWTAGTGGSQAITIPITDDTAVEGDETFTVALSSPSNNVSGEATSITGSPATVTIQDNDATVAFSAATQTVSEGVGLVTVTANRTAGGNSFAISVPFTVSGTAGSLDHNAVNGIITIPANQNSGSYTFMVTDDTRDEADETVIFTMGTPTGGTGTITAVAPSTQTVTIQDNDSETVSFSAASQSVAESVGSVTVTATRTGASDFATSVPFTVSGTASNPSDHNAVSGTITIPANATSGTYTFNVQNDAVDEPDETVVFTMGTPTGGDVTSAAPTTHTVTITDNDAVTVAFSTATQTVAENVGNVTITAVRTGATTFAVSVPFTVSGTATGGTDHNATSGTINIPANASSGSYTFAVTNDSKPEGDETVVFTMGTPTGGTVSAAAPTTETVTITKNDQGGGGGGAFGLTSLWLLIPAWLRRRRTF